VSKQVTASHPGEHRGRNRLGYGKDTGRHRALTSWREHRGADKLGHRKEVNERGTLTLWRVPSKRQVRTGKGSR
jgi:hypothetical protein